MPIDDPIDALKQQLKMEDLSVSPVTTKVIGVASKLPLPWPFNQAVEALKHRLATDSMERIRLMLETVIHELRKHDEEIRKLRHSMSPEDSQRRVETLRELLLDGARKAVSTRARERVRRIGLILANSGLEAAPPDADEIEEMVRIATELSDRDIEFLHELVSIEGFMLQTENHIPRFQAHQAWTKGWWGESVNPEIDSVFSKLESYGLVARIAPPNNLNISADFQNRYAVLKKGMRFVNLIRESAANDG